MQKINVSSYVKLGTGLRFLQDVNANSDIHSFGGVLYNIELLLKSLEQFNLIVTHRVAKPLEEFAEELRGTEKGSKLNISRANKLIGLITDIRKTLDAELIGFKSFIVSPKRIDVTKLMDDIGSLFSPGVFSILPEIARYDFTEAGKCIAFSLPTAAAFHILRGTEAVLRHFYTTLVHNKRVKPLMWGPIVTDLRKRPKTKKHDTLCNHLDNIRLSFRNPTQHPELIYDIHETEDLWAICVEVINRMIKILRSESI